jgi:hypothetical protein
MQAMTGKASAPRAISNDPISIFAEEKKSMASRKHAAQASVAAATVAPVAAEPVAPEAIIAATAPAVTAALAAQPAPAKRAKQAAKDPAKVAAAVAKLTQNPLERVVAQQTANPALIPVAQLSIRVADRVQAGQDLQAAIDAVFAQYRALVTEVAANMDGFKDAKHGTITPGVNTSAAVRFPTLRPLGKGVKGTWDALRGQLVPAAARKHADDMTPEEIDAAEDEVDAENAADLSN